MTEVFALRLFSSGVIKLENPDDNTIADLYNKTPQATTRGKAFRKRIFSVGTPKPSTCSASLSNLANALMLNYMTP